MIAFFTASVNTNINVFKSTKAINKELSCRHFKNVVVFVALLS